MILLATKLTVSNITVGSKVRGINVHLDYEPRGARPLLGEAANPYLSSDQQKVPSVNRIQVPISTLNSLIIGYLTSGQG